VGDWLAWDENSETRQKVAQLADQAAFTELQRMMAPRLLFGTAGIRGRMGPGFGQLNDLTIIQTTQVPVPNFQSDTGSVADPDPLVRDTVPDPSIFKQKY
jgi:hypothetical protein